MRKDYIKPHMRAIEIAVHENILESSYVNIGGETDRFDGRRHHGSSETDDEDDYEYE